MVLCLLLIVDLLGLNLETNTVKSKLGPIVKLGMYFILVSGIFKKLNLKYTKRVITILFSLVVLLNIFLIYNVVWSDSLRLNDNIERAIYLLYGIFVIGVCVAASNYNFRYSTKRSLFFFYTTFAFVLSDASWFIGYYLNYKTAFYFDTVFYFVALFYLIKYTLETDNEQDVSLDKIDS